MSIAQLKVLITEMTVSFPFDDQSRACFRDELGRITAESTLIRTLLDNVCAPVVKRSETGFKRGNDQLGCSLVMCNALLFYYERSRGTLRVLQYLRWPFLLPASFDTQFYIDTVIVCQFSFSEYAAPEEVE